MVKSRCVECGRPPVAHVFWPSGHGFDKLGYPMCRMCSWHSVKNRQAASIKYDGPISSALKFEVTASPIGIGANYVVREFDNLAEAEKYVELQYRIPDNDCDYGVSSVIITDAKEE